MRVSLLQVPITADDNLNGSWSCSYRIVVGRVFHIQGLIFEIELFLHGLEQAGNRFVNNMVCGN